MKHHQKSNKATIKQARERIYYYQDGNKKISALYLAKNGCYYYCVMDFTTMTWEVRNDSNDRIIKRGASNNKNVMYRQSRRAMKQLGVCLKTEIDRNRFYFKKEPNNG